jgi:alkylation response protein AidB-like acyl-CoA dehydrogenase
MNFEDMPEEAAFRAEVRAWFEAHATRRTAPDQRFGEGLSKDQYRAAAQAWEHKKAEAGYAAITAPKEKGGRGGTAAQQVVFLQESANYVYPQGIFEVSLGMCVPTLALWGTPAQKERWLAKGLAGDEIWCQLFSEPSAGSDTGNVRTRAVRDGDDWVINGQKIWTTGAQFSDFGVLLTRTDWDKPKQKGLTMFIIDMKAPGVEVRPIHTATDDYQFNEVFFTDLRVPDANRLGPECDGWKVMLSMLMQERMSVGGNLAAPNHKRIVAAARATAWDGKPAIEDARIRDAIAETYLQQFGLELLIRRAYDAIAKGGAPGPEMSAVKLVGAKNMQDSGRIMMDLAGPEGLTGWQALGENWRLVQQSWLGSSGARIAGGTDEILRNVIAERVLGLPGEVRTDKEAPFKDLPA